jgi:hypothetical protein
MKAKKCSNCNQLYHVDWIRKHKCPDNNQDTPRCECGRALNSKASIRTRHFTVRHYQCPGCKQIFLEKKKELHEEYCNSTPTPFTLGQNFQAANPQSPVHDDAADVAFRDQVLSELEANVFGYRAGTWGKETNKHLAAVLKVARLPSSDEVSFCTMEEAQNRVESTSTWDTPLVVSQKPFTLLGNGRPIEGLFNHMATFVDETISVQVPSRRKPGQSCIEKKFSTVRQRFLNTTSIPRDGPWNVLDMANVLPAQLPECLAGLNCQVLRIGNLASNARGMYWVCLVVSTYRKGAQRLDFGR